MTKTWITRIGMLALAAVMVFGFVGSAAAQGPIGTDRFSGTERRFLGALVTAVADAAGLEEADVRSALRDGQSLAEIATANGADPDAIAAQVVADLTAEIEQAVVDGNMRQVRADNLIERLDDVIARAMQASLTRENMLLKVRGAQALWQALVDQTGLTSRKLLGAAADGATLAEIATTNGIEPQAVVDAALASATEQLATAVEAGRITQEEMDATLAEATTFFAEAINQSLPERPLANRPTPVRDRIEESISNSLIGALAEAAGVEARDIVQDLVPTPLSLSEIAASYGLDTNAVIAVAEANITERINELVADGTLAEELAAELLDGLHEKLVERFESPFQLRGIIRDRVGRGGIIS